MKASEFFPTTKGAFGMFDSVEIIPADKPLCRFCQAPISYIRGKAYSGWFHVATGKHVCADGRMVAIPSDSAPVTSGTGTSQG